MVKLHSSHRFRDTLEEALAAGEQHLPVGGAWA
jgi:hypothetical protein